MERPGFSPETIDFLWGIRMNNNRDWFLSHKEDYLSRLYRPMLALAEELRPAFRDVPGMACKVSRIYRDTRMPQPDGPYKDGLWISFRPDAMYWGEHPCLYFDLHPEEAEYGFVLWHPKPAQMERFRRDLREAPERFLRLTERAERETGLRLTGDEYKRKKEGETPETARFYNLRSLVCCRTLPIGPELFAPELADTVRETLLRLLPLYEYFSAL